MIIYVAIFILLVIILSCCCSKQHKNKFTVGAATPVKSRFDGTSYKVHDRSVDAADTLAQLNRRIIDIMRKLRTEHGDDPAVMKLLARYNPGSLVENSPHNPEGETSYALDKGREIAMCLRDKNSGELHDLDTLTFVALHEITHIAIDAADHPAEFWDTFRKILIAAEPIYISPDFAASPQPYCGLMIDYNPLTLT